MEVAAGENVCMSRGGCMDECMPGSKNGSSYCGGGMGKEASCESVNIGSTQVISYAAFVRIFRLVLEAFKCRFKRVKEERSTMGVCLPGSPAIRVLVNLSSLHEAAKASRSETHCFLYLLKVLRQLSNDFIDLTATLQEGPPPLALLLDLSSMSRLRYSDAQCFSIDFEEDLKKPPSALVLWQFSKHSRELMMAPLIASSRNASVTDLWLRKSVLSTWRIPEEPALALALVNTSKVTRRSFTYYVCEQFGPNEREESMRSLEDIGYDLSCLVNPEHEPLVLVARFADHRALCRLIFPSFLSLISEALRCLPINVLFVPVDQNLIIATNCQSIQGLCTLFAILKVEEGDSALESPRSYRVTTLQNARGLVEVEPYAVVGGQVAIRIWEEDPSSGGTVPVVMMPMPTTLEEAEVLSFLDGSQNIPIFDEAAFAPWNVCWTCGKIDEELQSCSSCKQVRVCWAGEKGNCCSKHRRECELRRQIIKDPNPVKQMSSRQKSELLELLANTVKENIYSVDPYRKKWQSVIDHAED